MKITEYKSGAWTTFERVFPSGLYCIKVYLPNGNLHDKVRCDDYRTAREYLRAFNAIAKAA